MHVSALGPKITIFPAKKAQIALLLAKKITILAKYLDFADMFLEELANVVSQQTRLNKHAVKLEKGK